jgi:phospholipid/cholesterol/gamma-HCH transport system substrate-binding protein
VKRAIREHARDFVAIVALAVAGIAAALFILASQRFTFPEWVPGVGSDRFELKADFSSAQAVTPGQGQTVNIAGIKVGDVSSVDLENGAAVVTMEVENEYAPLIHRNASLLLRPRTGLQDMTVELDPGTRGQMPEGATIPLANTQPNVNPDEILAALDADTRDYLTLLLQAGAEGIGRNGLELSATFRRFEPTARDLKRISGALAKRRANLRQVIHDFRLVSEALAQSDGQLADFVTNSNAAIGSFARQADSIRAALGELPPALSETRGALASSNTLSLRLKPALHALLPSARALQPALEATQPFFRRTVGPVRNQLTPFARRTQPTFAALARSSNALGESTPPLAKGLEHLNALANALAYNPPGAQEEGYLFWASWLNHDTNAIYFSQDGGGPLRRGIVLLSCYTSLLTDPVVAQQPFLRTVRQLTNVPDTPETCGTP